MTELVQRAKQGDQKAWGMLYERTYREAYFVALKVSANEQDALDLMQEAYITAFERLHQLDDPTKFRSWLNMIVANRCRDYLKKKRPMLFTELENEDDAEVDWEDDREDATPEQILDKKETVRLVQEIIGELPEDQKLCLLLYYREELSVVQIAESLDVSTGTVKSRLNYARQKVKAKVLALEKQGTKLYGLAPIPFLLWLLRGEAQAITVPVGASLATGTAAAATAAESGATAATTTLGTTAAAVGTKTAASSAIAKILAGIAVVGAVSGGVAMYNKQEAPEEPQIEISGSIQLGTGECVDVGNTEPPEEPPAPEENLEIMAYYELLERGYTEDHLPIQQYAWLDLNGDGVQEFLAVSTDCDSAEILIWKAGRVEVAERFSVSVGDIYLINDRYLRFVEQGDSWWNATFYALDENFQVVSSKWMDSGETPAICYNGGGWQRHITSEDTREWVAITAEGLQYYQGLPGTERDVEIFTETAEPVVLQENIYEKSEPIILETDAFTLTLPVYWKGLHLSTITETSISLFETNSYHSGWGGYLVGIRCEPERSFAWYDEYYADLGVYQNPADGQLYHFIITGPTDVQYDDEGAWNYFIMNQSINTTTIGDFLEWKWTPVSN